MRIRTERRWADSVDFYTDPLHLSRVYARSALDNPEWDVETLRIVLDEAFLQLTDLEHQDGLAFARVARFLAGLEIEEDPVFAVMRDYVVRFLTGDTETANCPIIETDRGQVVQLGRGRDGKVRSVTLIKSDGGKVTSSDMRVPFRAVSELDAETRISTAKIAELQVLHSPDPSVVERAKENLKFVGRLTGDDKYRRAAELYIAAKDAGFASTRQLIMDEMYVSYNYAGVLVKRARDKGFLPPVEDTEEETDD